MTRDEAVHAVIDAWNNPGVAPYHHRVWQERLRINWPALARAVEALAKT